MRVIPLTQGKVALVDDEDYERVVAQGKWHYDRGCAARNGPWFGSPRRHKRIYMHRFILDAPDDLEVDHKNRERLDNRRSNLRLATAHQNCCNRQKRSNALGSRFKGVWCDKNFLKWRACIRFRGKLKHLGCFDDERDAARVYDLSAHELFGEFALLNFPEGVSRCE